jgi:protein TonB
MMMNMSPEEITKAESLDEIVFATRNKEYGAYDLRKRYKKNVNKSLFIAFVVLIITAGTPFIMALSNQAANNIVDETVEANLENIKTDKDDAPPPPPPPPPPPALEQQVKFTAPVVVDSVEEDVELATSDDIVTTTTNEEVTEEVVETEEVIQEVEEVVNFYVIEEKPEFPGGEEALLKYIADNTKYPEIAKENNIQGKVFVEFVIQKDGSVGDVKILRGVDPYLDAEAVRVVKSLPKWSPGKQRGKAVKVSFQVPINFKLY